MPENIHWLVRLDTYGEEDVAARAEDVAAAEEEAAATAAVDDTELLLLELELELDLALELELEEDGVLEEGEEDTLLENELLADSEPEDEDADRDAPKHVEILK